jgi:hypothetical protein
MPGNPLTTGTTLRIGKAGGRFVMDFIVPVPGFVDA